MSKALNSKKLLQRQNIRVCQEVGMTRTDGLSTIRTGRHLADSIPQPSAAHVRFFSRLLFSFLPHKKDLGIVGLHLKAD